MDATPSTPSTHSTFFRNAFIGTVLGIAAFGSAVLLFSGSTSSGSLRTGTHSLSSSSSSSSSSARGASYTIVERVYYSEKSSDEKKEIFEDFISTYGKSYKDDDEKTTRFKNFKHFLKLIDKRNAKETSHGDDTATHGITEFADWSEDEINARLLGYRSEGDDRRRQLKSIQKTVESVDEYTGNDSYVDWAGVLTTSVNNQGYCGSCWAFSTVEQVESDSIRFGFLKTDNKLSVQQLVSCDTKDEGCDGGNTETAYSYINAIGGLQFETAYPYSSSLDDTGTCEMDATKFAIAVSGYFTIKDEIDMINYVKTTGPLSICAAATSWTSYTGGVVSTCDDDVDHCVQITGINTDENYWIVRNSWGTHWGYSGYIYIKSGENMCSIANDPTYAEVALILSDPADE